MTKKKTTKTTRTIKDQAESLKGLGMTFTIPEEGVQQAQDALQDTEQAEAKETTTPKEEGPGEAKGSLKERTNPEDWERMTFNDWARAEQADKGLRKEFKPLTLEAQAQLKGQRRVKSSKVLPEGTVLRLKHDVICYQTTLHNAENAPSLALRRCGNKKLSKVEQAAVLLKGTEVRFIARELVRTRKGMSKGIERDVKVVADIIEARGQIVACPRTWLEVVSG